MWGVGGFIVHVAVMPIDPVEINGQTFQPLAYAAAYRYGEVWVVADISALEWSDQMRAEIIAHEGGHGLGVPHSTDPASLMYSPYVQGGTVTQEDFQRAYEARQTFMSPRAYVPGLTR